MKLFLVIAFVSAVLATPDVAPLPKSLLDKLASLQAQPESRIIDGEVAAANASPYIVSMSVSKLAYAHICAGAIIGKEWVLTAAHCLTELQGLNDGSALGLPVYAGLQDRYNVVDAQVRTIDFTFAHKQFNGKEGSDDIALLHVSPPFQFTAQVRQIALPYLNEDHTGVATATYGWGLTDPEAELYAKELQVAQTQVLSASECREQLPPEAPLSANHICASTAACYGDGGSPLVVQPAGGIAELIGITSWAYLPCGYGNWPSVYTAVSRYVDWIVEVQWAYYILH